jgi:hypothetical protein
MKVIPEKGRIRGELKLEFGIDALKMVDQEIIVTDALFDPAITSLALPESILLRLGLDEPFSKGWTGDSSGYRYGPVRLTILGRDMVLDSYKVANHRPVLLGRIPVEYMQLVINPITRRIEHSPANNGEWILDMF